MKRIFLFALFAAALFATPSCTKDATDAEAGNIGTPRTNPVPDELVGRWAIVSISGSTVYDIPAGSTYNTNEMFLGYKINKDGTTEEDGYIATYMYGVSTWTKWRAFGSVEIEGESLALHRDHGSYTGSNSNTTKYFGAAEVYPNKTAVYAHFEKGTDSHGNPALLLTKADGYKLTFVKQ